MTYLIENARIKNLVYASRDMERKEVLQGTPAQLFCDAVKYFIKVGQNKNKSSTQWSDQNVSGVFLILS